MDEQKEIGQEFLIPHEKTFSAIYNQAWKIYRTKFDEAQRKSYADSLAVRRDGLIHELLEGRKRPARILPFMIEVDNAKDSRQRNVASILEKIIKNTPRWKTLKGSMLEAIFYGKAGVQLIWGHKYIDGIKRVTVARHIPVNGDKIVWRYDGTPGILVNPTYKPPDGGKLIPTDRGMCLMLDRPFYRERFLIHEYEPVDTDFVFEADMAASVHGLGLRSRLWWLWYLRNEVLTWGMDALQRIGANGQYIGYVPSGDDAAVTAMQNALVNLVRDNVTVLELNNASMGGAPADSMIQRLDPSNVAYDVILNFVDYFESQMRRIVLGQNLSAESAVTGMGSRVAELHESTLNKIIRSDVEDLDETINDQLMPLLIKYNFGSLPFKARYKSIILDDKINEKIDTAQRLASLNVPLDVSDLREQAGFSAPKDQATSIVDRTGSLLPTPSRNARPSADEDVDGQESDPSILVSYWLPTEVAEVLALSPDTIRGKESKVEIPGDLHVTIAYCGRVSEQPDGWMEWLKSSIKVLTNDTNPLVGSIRGCGRFPASESSDGLDPVYADVDVKGLHEFRDKLVGWSKIGGLAVRDDFAYHPHVTLAYVGITDPSPVDRIESLPIMIDRIRITVGEQWEEIRVSEKTSMHASV